MVIFTESVCVLAVMYAVPVFLMVTLPFVLPTAATLLLELLYVKLPLEVTLSLKGFVP